MKNNMRASRPNYKKVFKDRKEYGQDWREIAKRIRDRDNNRCRICGNKEHLHVHHIKPLSKGGSNRSLNLMTLCRVCHSKQPGKGHKNL